MSKFKENVVWVCIKKVKCNGQLMFNKGDVCRQLDIESVDYDFYLECSKTDTKYFVLDGIEDFTSHFVKVDFSEYSQTLNDLLEGEKVISENHTSKTFKDLKDKIITKDGVGQYTLNLETARNLFEKHHISEMKINIHDVEEEKPDTFETFADLKRIAPKFYEKLDEWYYPNIYECWEIWSTFPEFIEYFKQNTDCRIILTSADWVDRQRVGFQDKNNSQFFMFQQDLVFFITKDTAKEAFLTAFKEFITYYEKTL